jgi:translation initiation factor 3 subunit B
MRYDAVCFSLNGVLEFVDTADMTVMAQTEHFMATDVEWDPTGRYVVSAVSWWGHKVSQGPDRAM